MAGHFAEQVELQFRRDHVTRTHLGGLGQSAAQRPARVSGGRLAVGHEDIAEQARRAPHVRAGRFPGHNGEGGQVRHQVHIGLDHAGEAFDRRPVEPHAPLKRGGQSGGVNGDSLVNARYVSEEQLNSLHFLVADQRENVVRVGGG